MQIRPELSTIMDDLTTAKESVTRLKELSLRTIYPGHGKPFAFKEFASQER